MHLQVGQFNWCARLKSATGKFYALRVDKNIEGKPFTLQLHAFLVGGMADHKNFNTLDNRQSCNIRPATYTENNRNKLKSKANTSGLKGAFWHKSRKKWTSQVRVDGRQLNLGTFATAYQAHEAYCRAAAKHYGEFCNFG